MKTKGMIFVCFMALTAVQAQDKDIIGLWTVFEMTQLVNDASYTMTEDSLQAHQLFEDYYFMEDAKFKQTGNLSGHGSVSTEEGSWQITDNVMIMTLQIGNRQLDVDYTWELKDKTLFLTRTNPTGTVKITMALRKKGIQEQNL